MTSGVETSPSATTLALVKGKSFLVLPLRNEACKHKRVLRLLVKPTGGGDFDLRALKVIATAREFDICCQ